MSSDSLAMTNGPLMVMVRVTWHDPFSNFGAQSHLWSGWS